MVRLSQQHAKGKEVSRMKKTEQGVLGVATRAWAWLSTSAFVVGLLGLAWFVFRTGTKPSRATYPCQRVAAAHGAAWLATYALPVLTITGFVGENRSARRKLLTVAVVLLVAAGAAWTVNGPSGLLHAAPLDQAVQLELLERRATSFPSSDLFVVSGTHGDDNGIAALIALLAEGGMPFYRRDEAGPTSGPSGLIAVDDVVLIKINAQWDQRGGTSTDLLHSLIAAIVDHPDGFTGEIIVADNGQGQYGPRGSGGSLDWSSNNAEVRSQSAQSVVDSFAADHRVSTYLWDTITRKRVAEYDEGDAEDGYVVAETKSSTTGALAAYPKFRSVYGTHVSFKHGIWNPNRQSYDSDRLKLVNVPVLKPHSIFGVTGCIKHYMGVTSDRLTANAGARAHNSVGTGGMGTEIAETRFPTLNILDAIWVSLTPGNGPQVTYNGATRVDVIAASTDPVALDYWAAKYILVQGARKKGRSNVASLDPDSERSFARWLRLSMNELVAAGYRATVDESRMNVYVERVANP
jgi:hypothetical protein